MTSRYTDEERARIMAEARALLEPTASERLAHADEEAWPVRGGTILPVLSTASMDRYREEALATERMLEQGRQERRQEERRIIRERQAAAMRRELDARTDAIVEAVAKFTVESIDKACRELRDEFAEQLAALRVELAARQDRSDKVLDLPALPSRRRSDAA